jgi:hypothetical protein
VRQNARQKVQGKMAKKMDDDQLGSIVSGEITDALNHFDNEYTTDRLRALDMYLGEPLGNEVDGRSTVISTEVADTVESIIPNLMRVFTTNDKYVRFSPRTAEDMESAEQASDYVNYVLNTQNPGYQILHTFFKDALLFRLGVVKFFYETREEVDEEEYSGLSEEELTMLLADPTVELVSQTETVVESMYNDETGETEDLRSEYDLTVRIKREEGDIKIINIPPEEFLVSRHATSLDDANFIAHRTNMTVSDLVAMGYDREEVEQYAGARKSSSTLARMSWTPTARSATDSKTLNRQCRSMRQTRHCGLCLTMSALSKWITTATALPSVGASARLAPRASTSCTMSHSIMCRLRACRLL